MKDWVSDPTEEAPNRWTNTETGEYRYQDTKPETEEVLSGEEDGQGAVGDKELRLAIERLENPDRGDVQEYFGLDEVDWSVYEDYGVDSFDVSTAVSMTLADYDTMEEFNSAVESGEFEVELQDNYSLYSDPDDLAELDGEIAQNIRDDAAQIHVEELVTQNADAVRSVTDEPEIPQGEEDGESTEDEEDENDEGYEDEYESFDLHNVEFSEVSEDDYLVIDGRRGREKIKVQSVEESDSGKVIISGVTPGGRSSGVVSGREGSEILGQLQDGEAYKSDVERGVQETIEQYEDTVQEVKDNFTNSDIRDGLEEFDAGRQGSFNRLSSSAAMELRSAITDAVGDKEAVNELWARMNEMKQSSTGSQREYVDALAKETFGMEDADTWGDADPDDYDFSEADKEAMAVTAAASQRVLSQAGDNKIHRGVRKGGSAQLAKAWLEDPMATDFEINENATANYSSLEGVARGYGDITVDKDVTEGAVLNANDMIRGMYRSSAAADEAEVWAPGSEQSVSSWDVSIGSERVEGEYERMYLGDYQGPIEEIEDEKFLRRMSKQIQHLHESEDVDSLSDEAKKNLQKFGERVDDVLGDDDFDEVIDDLMEKGESGSVIDLTDEAGWLDVIRENAEDGAAQSKIIENAVRVVKDRVYVDDPSEAPEDVSVREGERGGTWYPAGEDSDTTESGETRDTRDGDNRDTEEDGSGDENISSEYSDLERGAKINLFGEPAQITNIDEFGLGDVVDVTYENGRETTLEEDRVKEVLESGEMEVVGQEDVDEDEGGEDEIEVSSDIEEVTRDVTESFDMTEEEINSGRCMDWAYDVVENLDGEAEVVETAPALGPENAHWFVEHDGRYYDAESPGGVDDWRELDIWDRSINLPDLSQYEVRGDTLVSGEEKIVENAVDVLKERVYIDNPQEAPEGVQVQEGERGGLWYESEEAEGQAPEGDEEFDPKDDWVDTFEVDGQVFDDLSEINSEEELVEVLNEGDTLVYEDYNGEENVGQITEVEETPYGHTVHIDGPKGSTNRSLQQEGQRESIVGVETALPEEAQEEVTNENDPVEEPIEDLEPGEGIAFPGGSGTVVSTNEGILGDSVRVLTDEGEVESLREEDGELESLEQDPDAAREPADVDVPNHVEVNGFITPEAAEDIEEYGDVEPGAQVSFTTTGGVDETGEVESVEVGGFGDLKWNLELDSGGKMTIEPGDTDNLSTDRDDDESGGRQDTGEDTSDDEETQTTADVPPVRGFDDYTEEYREDLEDELEDLADAGHLDHVERIKHEPDLTPNGIYSYSVRGGGVSGTIEIRNVTDFYGDDGFMEEEQAEMFEAEGVASTSNQFHTILHEIGHASHLGGMEQREYNEVDGQELRPDDKEVAEELVSDQAAKNNHEFVAEVFAMKADGKEVPGEVQEIYERLGGPEL